MSILTYGDAWRRVGLYVPMAPALLVQDWVATAYKEACEERSWSFLRGEGEFLLSASKSGTAVVVQGSATVTGAGGAGGVTFAASDVGRQVRIVSSGPPLTITAVDVTGNTSATLERAWDGASNTAASVTVADLYATCPTDFGHFLAVLDPQNQRQIRVFVTDAELNAADPGRAATGSPWALVSYRRSALASTLDRVQYEWWPYFSTGTGTLRFPFYYIKRPSVPAEDDYFPGPFRDRADVVVTGALANAAEWPGTEQHKNPYFNLQLAAKNRERFKAEVGMLEVRDEETYLTWWQARRSEPYGMTSLAPIDASFWQTHE